MLAGVDEVEGCRREGGPEGEEGLDVFEGDVDGNCQGDDWGTCQWKAWWEAGGGERGMLTVAAEVLDEDLHCLGGLGGGGVGAREGNHFEGCGM